MSTRHHNQSQPLDSLFTKEGAAMQEHKTEKRYHIMTKVFERIWAVMHNAVDLFHQIPIGYILASVWAWGAQFFHFDYDFVGWLGIVFFVDTGTGVYKHIRKRTVSVEGFSKFFDKMVVLCGSVAIIHVIDNVQGGSNIVGEFYKQGAHLTVIAWLAGSALRNMSDIIDGKFPPSAWLDKIDSFLYRKNNKQ